MRTPQIAGLKAVGECHGEDLEVLLILVSTSQAFLLISSFAGREVAAKLLDSTYACTL